MTWDATCPSCLVKPPLPHTPGCEFVQTHRSRPYCETCKRFLSNLKDCLIAKHTVRFARA